MNFFESLNYRDLLKEILEHKRKENSFFSYRSVSKKAGIASTGFLSLVLAGKRNISNDLALRLCEVLKFNKRETSYFSALVSYNQTDIPEDKKKFFEELISLRPSNARSIQSDQQEYFNKWYYAAIRELISIAEVSDNNHKHIAAILTPQISVPEVREAIELLIRLGFVYRNEDGFYKRSDALLTAAGSSIDPSAIRKYQADTIDLARNALYSLEKELRDISTVTLSTNEDGMAKIKAKIEQCRSDIMAIAKQSTNSDRIIQVNMQLFPLSLNGRNKK
jgi:uncharacterized protein (TIGR02147 family)